MLHSCPNLVRANADDAGNILIDNVTRTVFVSGLFLGISSNNANYDNLAKEGDLVTIQLFSNHTQTHQSQTL